MSGLVRVALLLLVCVIFTVALLAVLRTTQGTGLGVLSGALGVAIGLWLLRRRHDGKL